MFKLLVLKSGVDDELQAIQNKWEISAVENIGADGELNHYLLVQYDIKPPSSNNTPSDEDKKQAPKPKQEK